MPASGMGISRSELMDYVTEIKNVYDSELPRDGSDIRTRTFPRTQFRYRTILSILNRKGKPSDIQILNSSLRSLQFPRQSSGGKSIRKNSNKRKSRKY